MGILITLSAIGLVLTIMTCGMGDGPCFSIWAAFSLVGFLAGGMVTSVREGELITQEVPLFSKGDPIVTKNGEIIYYVEEMGVYIPKRFKGFTSEDTESPYMIVETRELKMSFWNFPDRDVTESLVVPKGTAFRTVE